MYLVFFQESKQKKKDVGGGGEGSAYVIDPWVSESCVPLLFKLTSTMG